MSGSPFTLLARSFGWCAAGLVLGGCALVGDYDGYQLETESQAGGAGGNLGSAAGGADPCHPPSLGDEGLLVRYFLDEKEAGDVTKVKDATGTLDLAPWDLSPGGLAYESSDGHRGLYWPEPGMADRVQGAIGPTVVATRLNQSRRATVELVIRIDEVMNNWSRVFWLGVAEGYGHLALLTLPDAWGGHELYFFMKGTHPMDDSQRVVARGGLAPFIGARAVLHLVLDTTRVDPAERVRLYRSGAMVSHHGLDAGSQNPQQKPVVQDEELAFDPGLLLVLGNRDYPAFGGRSFGGKISYAALYDEALSPEAVEDHVQALEACDDACCSAR